MIADIQEYKHVLEYLEKRGLLEKYKKTSAKLLRGEERAVNFKKRQPKNSGIWSFRIDKKYRAFGSFQQNVLVVFEINDHQ